MSNSFDTLRHQVALAWYFALSDTRARYKHSALGPLWLVLSTLIGIGGLALVWGALMQADHDTFVPLLTIGLVLWQLISGSVVGAVRVFVKQSSIIKNIRTPAWRIALQLLFQQIINFAHNLILIVLVLAIFRPPISPMALMAIPGFMLVLINLLGVILVLGFLGARYRDLEPLITAIMPLLFFMSPVLFRGHQLGAHAYLLKLNPLGYWIEIVRDPILGTLPDISVYAVTIAMTVITWMAARWIMRERGHRLAYWV